jgi:hypothetical protein
MEELTNILNDSITQFKQACDTLSNKTFMNNLNIYVCIFVDYTIKNITVCPSVL